MSGERRELRKRMKEVNGNGGWRTFLQQAVFALVGILASISLWIQAEVAKEVSAIGKSQAAQAEQLKDMDRRVSENDKHFEELAKEVNDVAGDVKSYHRKPGG